MISKNHTKVTLVQIDNLHSLACGEPPSINAAGKYVSYFESRLGEQWVLVGDRVSGKALVRWRLPLGESHGGLFRKPLSPHHPAGSRKDVAYLPASRPWATSVSTDNLGPLQFKQSGSEN